MHAKACLISLFKHNNGDRPLFYDSETWGHCDLIVPLRKNVFTISSLLREVKRVSATVEIIFRLSAILRYFTSF